EIGIHRFAPATIPFVDRVARVVHAKAAGQGRGPFLVGHLPAIGGEPANVLDAATADRAPLKEGAAREHRMLAPQPNELLYEATQSLVVPVQLPVDPGNLVVLAVGVVVAMLRASQLIAGQQHGYALREQE